MGARPVPLDHNERWRLLNALTVASERADADADMMRSAAAALRSGEEIPVFAPGEAGARAADALARQHQQNATDYRVMWERLEAAEGISITPGEDED